MTISKAIARAWSDAKYKDRLLTAPRDALAEVGVHIPPGATINVVEDTGDTRHVVLPMAPDNASELSIAELEGVAGGMHKGSYPSS